MNRESRSTGLAFISVLVWLVASASAGWLGIWLVCGLAWGALRAATGSLVPTLVAHLLWDVLVLLWLPLDPG